MKFTECDLYEVVQSRRYREQYHVIIKITVAVVIVNMIILQFFSFIMAVMMFFLYGLFIVTRISSVQKKNRAEARKLYEELPHDMRDGSKPLKEKK